MLGTGAVSRQAVDERVAAEAAQRAAVDALQANVERIRTLRPAWKRGRGRRRPLP